MKKYSNDPIVEAIHKDREERYQRLVDIMGGSKKKRQLRFEKPTKK